MKFVTAEEDYKYFRKAEHFRAKCNHCGHTVYNMKEEREICSWCNHWIYKNKKIEFKYKMKEKMRNEHGSIRGDNQRRKNIQENSK